MRRPTSLLLWLSFVSWIGDTGGVSTVPCGGRDDGDLHWSWRTPGGWSPLVRLGHGVNTLANGFTPELAPDGCVLLFTSSRPGEWPPLRNGTGRRRPPLHRVLGLDRCAEGVGADSMTVIADVGRRLVAHRRLLVVHQEEKSRWRPMLTATVDPPTFFPPVPCISLVYFASAFLSPPSASSR